jgi:osmotically inducible protein OsmC
MPTTTRLFISFFTGCQDRVLRPGCKVGRQIHYEGFLRAEISRATDSRSAASKIPGLERRNQKLVVAIRPIAEKHRKPRNEVLVYFRFWSETALMNLIIRKASVRWKGGVKGGTRAVTTESGLLKQAGFSINMPSKGGSCMDPSELIAAAQASSFSLALSNELGLKALATGEIVTTAIVTLENLPAGWTIMDIHLNVVARLPKLTQGEFIDATIRAKTNCMVSRCLRTNLSMNAKLEK